MWDSRFNLSRIPFYSPYEDKNRNKLKEFLFFYEFLQYFRNFFLRKQVIQWKNRILF